jgi:hypothetical protein
MSYFDLHMTIIFPEDITERVSSSISGNTIIPFGKKYGLFPLLYLYGRDNVVLEKPERVLGIANKTVETLENSIEKYCNNPKSLFDLQYSRNNYMTNFNLIIP